MTVRILKNSLIVELTGEIDHHSTKEIKNITESKLEDADIKNIIYDFTNVDFMDSSGVGLVIGRYKTAQKSGGTMAITGVSGTIDRIMDISGVYKIIKCYKTPEEALEAIGE